MPLFAKNRPTERLDFEGGFVELQYLSKGVKDEIKSRSTAAFKGTNLQQLQNAKSESDIPTEMLESIPKLMSIEYYKLAHAILKWSDDAPITEDTVKDLDEEMFDQISKKVDEMNQLTSVQEKN